MSSRNGKANLRGVYNVEKHTFVGSKEGEQEEGNSKKEAAVKGSGPCELVLREFQKAEESGRVDRGCVTHSNGLSFLQTTFKG